MIRTIRVVENDEGVQVFEPGLVRATNEDCLPEWHRGYIFVGSFPSLTYLFSRWDIESEIDIDIEVYFKGVNPPWQYVSFEAGAHQMALDE